jgi:Protein of unknown function (DUF3352)
LRSVHTSSARRWGIAVGLTTIAVAIGGCGSSSSSSAGDVDPATVVPASAAVYASVLIHPTGSLKSNELAAAQKLTHQTDPIGSLIGSLQSSSGSSINYAKDIKPWIGDHASLFISSIDLSGASNDLLGGGLTKLLSKSLFDGSGADAVQGALVLQTSDVGKARSFLDQQASKRGAHSSSYRGVTYKVDAHGLADGIVDRLAVIGSEAGLKSVIDTSDGAPAIAHAATYTKLAAGAEPGAIANAYLSLDTLRGQIKAGANETSLLGLLRRTLGGGGQVYLSLVPTSSTIALDLDTLPAAVTSSAGSGSSHAGGSSAGGSSSTAQTSSAQILGQLPADSWLALGVGNVQRTLGTGAQALRTLVSLGDQISVGSISLKGALDPLLSNDVLRHDLSWIQTVGLFAGGSGLLNLQAGVVIGSTHANDIRQTIPVLAKAYRDAGAAVSPVSIPGADTAVMVRAQGLPIVLDIASSASKLVLGLGPASVSQALSPSTTLTGSSTYGSAASILGNGIQPSLIVDVPTVVGLLETLGLNNQPTIAKLFPYLQSISALTAGGVQKLSNGATRSRVVIGLQQSG